MSNRLRGLKGSIVALITPFCEDGSVDFEALGKLLDWHVENGTDAILTLGTTGESSTMTQEEDDLVCDFTIKRVGDRIPVIAGSGSNCTEAMLERSIKFEKMGAHGLLLISPYYIKANEEGMYQHFASVADAVNIPCYLYNVPGRTGCNIPEEVVRRLSVHPNILGIKEASGNMSYVAKISRYLTDDFALYSGEDDLTIPMMSLGASGTISVLANIMPKETHDMVMSYVNGDVKKAASEQLRLLRLVNNLFTEVNPIPVKTAMGVIGLCRDTMRLPLYDMSAPAKEVLVEAMKEVGLV